MIDFQVSVIIPVYNAENYLRRAVESAVVLEEVGEVILVEDASPDNALELCFELQDEYSEVKLVRHPGNKNKGAAASRNLGINTSQFPYLAFLDADDWYLPNRFQKEKQVFSTNPKADVVYSSSILDVNQEDYTKMKGANLDVRKIIGREAKPDLFFSYLLENHLVLFDTNGVTIKKDFLLQNKLFDERLNLHEDTELWLRLYRKGYFFAGEINKPVAIVRRHEDNRITSRNSVSELYMYAVYIQNVEVENMFDFEKQYLMKRILRVRSKAFSSDFVRRGFFYFYYYFYSTFGVNEFLRKYQEKLIA